MEKNAVLYFLEDVDGDTARDVDAAQRQNFQCQIPCFRAVNGRPEIQRVGADTARLVQPAASDLRCGIGVGILERRVLTLGARNS